jgi:hypothetical protein
MKNIQYLLLLLLAWGISQQGLAQGQTNIACQNLSSAVFYEGSVFFNYGSTSNAFNSQNRSTITVGQPTVGESLNQDYNAGFGFWTRFLLTPSAPAVTCTEGDLPDRINISWVVDPLSPVSSSGFNIYRDGSLLTSVDNDVKAFVDFNVIAGQFYTYTLKGKNQFGEGQGGSGLGFLNPNGVVTGQIKTFTGNPVPGAAVTLSPTIGTALNFTGSDKAFAEYNAAFPTNKFTVSCWVKIGSGNDDSGILDLGSSLNKNWWIHTLPAASGKGVRVGIGTGSAANTIDYAFPAATADDWHQVTMTYNGGSLILYADGEFVGTIASTFSTVASSLFFGQKNDGTSGFNGKLDEVRIFSKQLSQTDIQMTLHRTINSDADALVAYWKFDEGTGSKGFDISAHKIKSYLCGPAWTTDKPTVQNAGITDDKGFYKIDGVNYGAGQTFTATPEKFLYYNQSLEFNASNGQYADLTTFDLPDTSTVTAFFKPFDLSGDQTILSKQGSGGAAQMRVALVGGVLTISLGTDVKTFGALTANYHHVAFTTLQMGGSVLVKVYVDGTQVGGDQTFTGVPSDFNNGTPWTLGGSRSSGGVADANFFTGLIDEVAVFAANLSLPKIQTYANIGTDISSSSLKYYFNLNEGSLDSLMDMGTAMSGKGVLHGATWSVSTAIPHAVPHQFSPSSKLVSLNPSNTSTDGVDFTDMSTIPVSGFVRYEGTDCFAQGVEILVNGSHASPPAFTDGNGKFVIDFEPGKTFKISPKFKNHTFNLNFWEIRNLSTPVAGILFLDKTKRSIKGQLAGGHCRKSIIPMGGIVKMKVASIDGCYEQVQQLIDPNGKFTFAGLPPFDMVISLIQHSDNVIYNYFQLKGGTQTDLSSKNDTVDFIYYAPPNIETTALDTNKCGDPMLEQTQKYNLTIRVYQDYYGEKCYLDTADLHINNAIADITDQFDTTMTKGTLTYRFKAGLPNLVPPYLKTISVEADANDQLTTTSLQAVVLGKRPRQVNFASSTPSLPILILRDPPGDKSFSKLEQNTKVCNTMTFEVTKMTESNDEVELDLGLKTSFETGIGFAKETEIEFTNSLSLGVSARIAATKSNTMETCVTTGEVFQTSAEEFVTGADADLFVGGAMNMLFGITDDLRFDTTTCNYAIKKGLIVFPDKFNTTFIYTAAHIKEVVIPDLLATGDVASANRWQSFLTMNENQKKAAAFDANYSFNAGIEYERTTTTEKSQENSFSFEAEISNSIASEIGFHLDAFGASVKMDMKMSTGTKKDLGFSTSKETTVGFTLADNDEGDYFSVDVKKDRVYGTPVFKTVSGASSCPYEANTVNRDEVAMVVDHFSVDNVPENGAASFKFNLGNLSQTEELRNYFLFLGPESNPLGAVVKANGTNLASPQGYQIPYGEPIEVTVTVERGPGGAYDYNDLEIALEVACWDEQATALGIAPEEDPRFYKQIFIDAHFVEPCSRVDIGYPLQDWVLTPADGNIVNITAIDYNKNDPSLELIRAQYRRTQGDGSWINIAEVQKADLGPIFKIIPWNTNGLKDGLYEVRIVSQCFSGQNAGISHVMKGKIERTPPEIFGTPEPADGVLSAGDEISIQFTEPIRCDLLIGADQTQNNNVGLYDTETGDLVDAIFTCSGDKIVIVPNVPNKFIENKRLRVEIDNIKDLASNNFVQKKWEFVVDRNPIRWTGGNVDVTKYVNEFVTVSRRIENNGGDITNYTIEGIPDWVRIFPKNGSLSPGASQLVTFEFDSTMAIGGFVDTLKLDVVAGIEPLYVNARVICKDPPWSVNPANFTYSMNMSLQLNIEGTLSTDNQDIVAAFINGECRGKAKVQYVAAVNKWEAFLTVYSDDFSGGDIALQIWDASACTKYGSVVETFTFESDDLVGTPQLPMTVHTNNLVLREIPLHIGWNWISFNLQFPNPDINVALASLQHPENDFVKGQSSFSQYYTSGFNTWIGSLQTLTNPTMYQYRADLEDTIKMIGHPIDPALTPITLSAGWNWLGYLPQSALPVNTALASLTPLNGDVIKSQTAFAQYVAGFGWLGNLTSMSAPNGYLMKLSNGGILTYPANNVTSPVVDTRSAPGAVASHWSVDPTQFEQSMTLIGFISDNGQNITTQNSEIAAFVNGQVRGDATAIYIEPIHAYLLFLTIYANQSGELLNFKLFDGVNTSSLNETLYFSADAQIGSVDMPQPFTTTVSGTQTAGNALMSYFEVQPNPFREQTYFQFSAAAAGDAVFTISNALGAVQGRVKVDAHVGLNGFAWDGRSEGGAMLPSGVYFVRLEVDGKIMDKKVVVQH